MSGPRPKPDERRQRRNAPKKGSVGVVPPSPISVPPPPAARHWSAPIKRQWSTLWSHPIVQAYDRTVHEPGIRRLFDLRDEREKLTVIVRASPMVEGSQGQEVAHPLYGRLGKVEVEIRNLEQLHGLNPKALIDLGMSFNEAKRSIDDLARSAGDDEDDEDDPRTTETVGQVLDAESTAST